MPYAAAHPLCDQLKYVANTNKEAHELYITALRKWERSAYAHPFLTAISTYVRNGSVLKDLTKCGVLALEKGGGYDEKQMICWRVLGIPTEVPAGRTGISSQRSNPIIAASWQRGIWLCVCWKQKQNP